MKKVFLVKRASILALLMLLTLAVTACNLKEDKEELSAVDQAIRDFMPEYNIKAPVVDGYEIYAAYTARNVPVMSTKEAKNVAIRYGKEVGSKIDPTKKHPKWMDLVYGPYEGDQTFELLVTDQEFREDMMDSSDIQVIEGSKVYVSKISKENDFEVLIRHKGLSYSVFWYGYPESIDIQELYKLIVRAIQKS